MKQSKILYLIYSALLFLAFAPFFNGLFAFIITFLQGQAGPEHFSTLILISYLTTFSPALLIGVIYGIVSRGRQNKFLIWFIPLLGLLVYATNFVVYMMMTDTMAKGAIYSSLFISILGLISTFACTAIANSALYSFRPNSN